MRQARVSQCSGSRSNRTAPSGVSMTTFVPSGFAAGKPAAAASDRHPCADRFQRGRVPELEHGRTERAFRTGHAQNCDVPASVYEPPSSRPVGDVSSDTGPAGGRVEEQQRPLRVTHGGDGLTVGAVDERGADLTALFDLSELATASDVDEGEPAGCGVVADGDNPTVGAERGAADAECGDVAVAEAVLLRRTTGVGDVPEHDGAVGARDGGEDRPGRAPCHADRSASGRWAGPTAPCQCDGPRCSRCRRHPGMATVEPSGLIARDELVAAPGSSTRPSGLPSRARKWST